MLKSCTQVVSKSALTSVARGLAVVHWALAESQKITPTNPAKSLKITVETKAESLLHPGPQQGA